MGIHNIDEKVQRRLETVENSDQISTSDKKYFENFYNWLRTTGERGSHRINNYLFSLHKILKYHDFDLQPLNEDKIESILVAVEDSEYKERGQGGYSKETKAEYRKTIKRICEKEKSFDLLPKDRQGKIQLKTHVPKSEKERTRPDQLPSVEDAKKIAQKIQESSRSYSVLRNLALFYVTYESGARIGEILEIKIRDVTVENEKLIEIYIPGNKDSKDRKNLFVLSAPILRRYLEISHPSPDEKDAYLFCNIKEKQGDQMSYENVSDIFNRAGKAAEVDAKFNPHIFRKKRISFLKIYMDMSEAVIDKKVGHVPGSDTTRIYTRIDDKEMLEQYKQAYGLKEKDEGNPEKIHLWPQRCSNCSTLVEGHRDVCYSCGEIVDEKAFGEIHIESENDQEKEKMMKHVENILEEKGILEQLKGDIE